MEGSPHGKSGGGPFDESSADTFRKQQRDRSQTRSAAGPGRSEHWNVNHLTPSRLQRESPTHPHVPCERRTDPAEPPHKPVKRSGTGPERALERPPPNPLAPSARKSHSSPRSLRAQDRSRWSPPAHSPSDVGLLKIVKTGTFCVNRWDRPRPISRSPRSLATGLRGQHA